MLQITGTTASSASPRRSRRLAEIQQAPALSVRRRDGNHKPGRNARQALLAKAQEVAVVPGDARDPDAILADSELTSIVSLADPVCVLLSGLLHFLDASAAREVAAAFTRKIAPGSYVVISVGTGQSKVAAPFTAAYTAAPLYIHAPDEIMTFFDGLELVPPGLVPARGWVGGAPPRQLAPRSATFLAGVGRKPQ